MRYPKSKENDKEVDFNTPPYMPCRIQYYTKDKKFRNLVILDENKKPIFESPCSTSPLPLVKQGQFVECELLFSNVWYGKDSFGIEAYATHIQIHSSQGVIQEIEDNSMEAEEEEQEEEEFQLVDIQGKSYYIENKNHGSFVYTYIEGEIEDVIGEEVGVYVHGVPRFF